MGVSIPFCIGFLLMGFTYFGRHKAMLYFGRLLSGTMNGAATPVSQIYVIIFIILHQILVFTNITLKKNKGNLFYYILD